MADSLFNPGSKADVDVETLMARIRDRVASRTLAASERTTVPSDLASVPTDTSRALSAQADFNQSLMGALGAIGRSLQAMQERMVGVERRLEEDIQRDREAREALV